MFGFLTTAVNAIVAPIRPKATPVILLTTHDEVDVCLSAKTEHALELQGPLPDRALKIVARGERSDDKASRSTSRIQALHRNDRKRLGGSSSPSGRVTTCVKHRDHIDRCICFAKKQKIGKAAEKRPARLMGRGGELPRVLGNSCDDYAQRVSKLRRNFWRMRLVPIQCVVEIRPRVSGEPNAQHS